MNGKFLTLLLTVTGAVLLFFAMPGADAGALAYVALVPLLTAVRRNSIAPWKLGMLFGTVFFFLTLFWIRVPVNYFGNQPMVVALVVLFIFSLYLSCYWAVFAFVAEKNNDPLLLGVVVVGAEAVKGALFTGFPWANIAQAFTKDLYALQWVSLFGEYGLTFIVVVINVLLYRFLSEKKKRALLGAVVLLVFVYGFGAVRVHTYEYGDQMKTVRIVQPGYTQEDKLNRFKQDPIIELVRAQIHQYATEDIDLLVLPESVFPGLVQSRTDLIFDLVNASQKTAIAFGMVRYETNDAGDRKYYNSLALYDKGELQLYDKLHLVPFGEYFPFEEYFKPISQYFLGPGESFSSGAKGTILTTGDFRIAPLICFEGAFTTLVKPLADMGSNLIVLISNDSWFGRSWGRDQHFAIDVLRAVEYGRTVVRSTQSGISAFILPDGTVSETIGVGGTGVITQKVPLKSDGTIFQNIYYSWLLAVMVWVVYQRKRRQAEAAV